jgi:hypothetical protein
MKDYFYGITEALTPRPIIFPLSMWAGAAVAVGCLLVGLSGCASTESGPRVCYVKPMGATEDGSWVVAQMCMTPEAFAESQK